MKIQTLSLVCFVLHVTAAAVVAAPVALRIPIVCDKPADVKVETWPLTTGVPFPRGTLMNADELTVVDAEGQVQACQFNVVSRWPDKSVRWAQVDFAPRLNQRYFVTRGKRPMPKDDIRLVQENGGIAITTEGATYTFAPGEGCFRSLRLEGRTVIDNAGGAFYTIDSQGRRGVLGGGKLEVALSGPRHVVIHTDGEYGTADGKRNAVGSVYFHFYAGVPWVRICHKHIISEETLDLWFKDIGVDFPLNNAGWNEANFNTANNDVGAMRTVPLAAGQAATMAQTDYPHFAATKSRFTLSTTPGAEVMTGAAAGDWAEIASPRLRLGLQMPGLAEQFPTAISVSPERATVKFWAPEGGLDLDFRTPQIVKNYFGHDWIPAEHKVVKVANTARGAAKTHELWLYPHELTAPTDPRPYGATAREIYATVDPEWVATSGVMDAFQPVDRAHFPVVEQILEDYFDTYITIPERIFPNTGYIGWGRNPYASVNWIKRNGRWYPPDHRLGRCLEYNLKRGVWVLYARSGERKYHDYARRYTRFLHDWMVSNWDTGIKPKGWFIQGLEWDSPCFWGAFPEEVIRKDEKAPFISNVSCLGYGTSEDTIQFCYDWFMRGDYHSRDAAQNYKDAVVKELNFDVDKAMTVIPTYVILRPLAAAYEIDQDPRIKDYGHKILERLRPKNEFDPIDPAVPQNYWKDGEIWAAFYHFYTSTGDPLAREYMLRGARRYYRMDRVQFLHRGSTMFANFRHAYHAWNDPAYIAYLHEGIRDLERNNISLATRGVKIDEVNQAYDKDWGHSGAIVTSIPMTVGLPVALRALREFPQPQPTVPPARKYLPTARTMLLLKKEKTGKARIDVYVNNFGDRTLSPALYDTNGKAAPLKVLTHEANRPGKPHGSNEWQGQYNPFFTHYGTHDYFQLETTAPSGVYRLDVGDNVAYTVLYSSIEKIMQSAPEGAPLQAGQQYFFNVDRATASIDYFAHRPIKLFDPSGNEVASERTGPGLYRLATGGKAGTWRLETASDKLMYDYPYSPSNAFVRFINAPLVYSQHKADRLFAVDMKPYQPATATVTALPKDTVYTDGRFGQGLYSPRDRFVELPVKPEAMPREQGTVEFWIRPLFSTTDLHMEKVEASYHRQQLLRLDPILVSHEIEPMESGRGGNYNNSKLSVMLRKQKGGEYYQSTLFLRAGNWYHVAVTWNVDGNNTDIEIFLNGHHATYDHYIGGVAATVAPADLPPPASLLRFGGVATYSYFATPGEILDDLRVSRIIRYRDTFTPPAKPFTADAATAVLMNFDGAAHDIVSGNAATVKSGSKIGD